MASETSAAKGFGLTDDEFAALPQWKQTQLVALVEPERVAQPSLAESIVAQPSMTQLVLDVGASVASLMTDLKQEMGETSAAEHGGGGLCKNRIGHVLAAPEPMETETGSGSAVPTLAWSAGVAVVHQLVYNNAEGAAFANSLLPISLEAIAEAGQVLITPGVRHSLQDGELAATPLSWEDVGPNKCPVVLNSRGAFVRTENVEEEITRWILNTGQFDAEAAAQESLRSYFPSDSVAKGAEGYWMPLSLLYGESPVSVTPTTSRGVACVTVVVVKYHSTEEQAEKAPQGLNSMASMLFPPMTIRVTGTLEVDGGRPHGGHQGPG